MASYGGFNRDAHESEGGQSGAILDLKPKLKTKFELHARAETSAEIPPE